MKILTFDIEDWFHILDNKSTKTEKEWVNYPSRANEGVQHILSILEKKNIKATFFILGWIAHKYPNIVKAITNKGHEIGSHSYSHQLVYEQTPDEFKSDLKKSIKILEDLTGKKITYYRSPGFSVTKNCKWIFPVLHENGIEVDCSIFPTNRTHGGFPEFPSNKPVILEGTNFSLREFPQNTISFFGKKIIFSGGGYFRFFPYQILKYWTNKQDYLISYFHPRDFDSTQPMIEGLNIYRRFKSYYGLKYSSKKFEQWINDFEFISLGKAIDSINWKNAKCININNI